MGKRNPAKITELEPYPIPTNAQFHNLESDS